MNYKQEAALQASKAKMSDYDRALVMYGPYPSKEELEYAAIQLETIRLKMAASVLNRLVSPTTQKSNCGCSGKSSASAGYSTKSATSTTRQSKSRNLFAMEFERLVCESNDAAYEAFCKKCDSYL